MGKLLQIFNENFVRTKISFILVLFIVLWVLINGSSDAVMVRMNVTFEDSNVAVVSGYLEVQQDELVSGVQMDISITPVGWSLMGLIGGEVAVDAGKEVLTSVFGDVVRVLVVGFNNQSMASGQLFTLLVDLGENVSSEGVKFVVQNLLFTSPDATEVSGSSVVENNGGNYVTVKEGEDFSLNGVDLNNTNNAGGGDEISSVKTNENRNFSRDSSDGGKEGAVNKSYFNVSNVVADGKRSELHDYVIGGYVGGYEPYWGEGHTQSSGHRRNLPILGKEIVVGERQNVVVARSGIPDKVGNVGLNYGFVQKIGSIGVEDLELQSGGKSSSRGLDIGLERNSGYFGNSGSVLIRSKNENLLAGLPTKIKRFGDRFSESSQNYYPSEIRRSEWTSVKILAPGKILGVEEEFQGIVPVSLLVVSALIIINLLPKVVFLIQGRDIKK